jgi:hypothetical protein
MFAVSAVLSCEFETVSEEVCVSLAGFCSATVDGIAIELEHDWDSADDRPAVAFVSVVEEDELA